MLLQQRLPTFWSAIEESQKRYTRGYQPISTMGWHVDRCEGSAGLCPFDTPTTRQGALAFIARTRLFTLAESLGAVESLIEHPARMTHASVVGSPLAVDPSLIRLSIGLETVDDLLDDLETALE